MKKIGQFSPKKSGISKFKKKNPYNTLEWVEYRNLFLKHNPKCYACGARATVVDHLRPFRHDKTLFLDKPDNFIPLCKPCHDFCTGSFDQHIVPKTEEKIKWFQSQRLKNEINFKIKVIDARKKD